MLHKLFIQVAVTSFLLLVTGLSSSNSVYGQFEPEPVSIHASDISPKVMSEIERQVTEAQGSPPSNGLIVDNVEQLGNWMFGTIALPATPDVHSGPESYLFLARLENEMAVALDISELFRQWIYEVPDKLIPTEAKQYLSGEEVNLEGSIQAPTGNSSASLSLPWQVRDVWRLTGGPHKNDSTKPNDPLSAIDFNIAPGKSGPVYAAQGGVAYRPCTNFVRIDSGGGWQSGYYHLTNIQINNGDLVPRGTLLGYTSKEAGCQGRADGPHVHFTLRKNGVFQNIDGHDIGGWTVQKGGSEYTGCMIKNGFSRCTSGDNQIWNDGGIGFACPVGQMQAVYYNNRNLTGNPIFWRCESAPFYDWGGNGPGNGIGTDNFSVRWSGQYDFDGKLYQFTTRTDDGVRLWLDNELLIDRWNDQGATTYYAYRTVSGRHTPMMEYYENGGGAVAQMRMSTNLAQGKPANATSIQGSGYEARKGNDGNTSTRWSSAISSQRQWWIVDLGSTQTLDKVRIKWEAAYAAYHFVGWSNDNKTFYGFWYSQNSAEDRTYHLGPRSGRYLGVLMDTRAPCCGNYSFWELGVYNSGGILVNEDPFNALFIGEPEELRLERD